MTKVYQPRDRCAITIALTLCCGTAALGQDAFYTFKSGPFGDGFPWPPSPAGLANNNTFFAPNEQGQDTNVENFCGNPTFFDTQYLAAGNSSLIDEEAWWGNPLNWGPEGVGLGFYNTTRPVSIRFDFSWAVAGQHADEFVCIDIYDDSFNIIATPCFELVNTFNAGGAFGGFNGREGVVELFAYDYEDPATSEPLEGFESIVVVLTPVATPGGTGEFAMDNLSINGAEQACPADTDGNETVNVTDLLTLLAAWGNCPAPCPPTCAADLNGDCVVNVSDLLALLGSWGPCP